MSDLVRLLCGACPASDRRVLARVVDTDAGPMLKVRSRRTDLPSPSGVSVRNIREKVDVLVADLGDPYRHTDGIVVGCDRHGWGVLTPEFVVALVDECRSTRSRVVRVLDIA